MCHPVDHKDFEEGWFRDSEFTKWYILLSVSRSSNDIYDLSLPGDARATALRHSAPAAAPVNAHAGDHPCRILHLGPALSDGLRRLSRSPKKRGSKSVVGKYRTNFFLRNLFAKSWALLFLICTSLYIRQLKNIMTSMGA